MVDQLATNNVFSIDLITSLLNVITAYQRDYKRNRYWNYLIPELRMGKRLKVSHQQLITGCFCVSTLLNGPG